MRLPFLVPLFVLLGACIPTTSLPPTEPGGEEGVARAPSAAFEAGQNAARNFLSVIAKVEPVAEALCRKRGVARSLRLPDRHRRPPRPASERLPDT